MTYGDNPAQRLLDLLTDAQAHGHQPCVAAWYRIFDVDDGNLSAFMASVADTTRLAALTRTGVEALPGDDPELVLRNFHKVEQTLAGFQSVGSYGVMRDFLAGYDEVAAFGLQMAASLLHRRQPEAVIGDDELARITDQLQQLKASITTSDDLDDEAKLWILGLLAAIEDALRRVRIVGSAGLDAATDRLVGAIARSTEKRSKFTRSKVGPALMALLVALSTATSTGLAWKELLSDDSTTVIEIHDGPGASTP